MLDAFIMRINVNAPIDPPAQTRKRLCTLADAALWCESRFSEFKSDPQLPSTVTTARVVLGPMNLYEENK